MSRSIIADTGPIVAFLNADDDFHNWAVEHFKRGPLPFLTCDAVLTEVAYLLDRDGLPREHVLDLVRTGALRSDFDINAEADHVADLLARYFNIPMDFADGCLVRMIELDQSATILTLDSDFLIYRQSGPGARVIPTEMPPRG